MAKQEIEALFGYLAVERHINGATQAQTLFYTLITSSIEIPWLNALECPNKPKRLLSILC